MKSAFIRAMMAFLFWIVAAGSFAVAQTATTTTVTSSPSTTGLAVPFTLVANVTSPGNAATGDVFFYFDNFYVGSGTLTAGTASFAMGPWTSSPDLAPSVGAHVVRAQYAGDADHAGSTSVDHEHIVQVPPATITLSRSPNTSTTFGQSLQLTATVSGTPTPTGTVSFFAGTAFLTATALTNGVATVSTSDLGAATHALTARYNGNQFYGAVTSSVLNHTVLGTKTTPTVTLSASPAGSSNVGQSVEFTARVSNSATGTVTFRRGSIVIGTASLSAGSAKVRTATLPLGPHNITARYNGSTSLNAITSAALPHARKATTRTTLSTLPKLIKPDQTVTLTATVAKVTSSSAALTGKVAFMRGVTTIRVETLVNGKATMSAKLPVGQHEIRAVYSGSTAFGSSESAEQFVEVGYARGNEFRVSVATQHDQKKPAVTALDDHAVAVWMGQTQAGGPYGLFARLFDESGLPDGGEIAVAQPSYSLDNPAITRMTLKRYAVAWEAQGSVATGKDIYVRLFNGRTALNTATRVNTLTTGDQINPAVFQTDGNLVVVWQSLNTARTKSQVYARIYNYDGNALGAEFRVHDNYPTETAFAPTGTRLIGSVLNVPKDAGFVIGWLKASVGLSATPTAQRFDLAGKRVGGPFVLTGRADISDLTLTALPLNQFVASWAEMKGNPTHSDVMTRLFDKDNKAAAAMTVTGGLLFNDRTPALGKLGSYTQNVYGRSLAFLSTPRNGTKTRVMVQTYSSTGPLLATPFPLDSGKASTVTELAATDLGRGWYSLVIWNAYGQDGQQGGIYGRLVATQ